MQHKKDKTVHQISVVTSIVTYQISRRTFHDHKFSPHGAYSGAFEFWKPNLKVDPFSWATQRFYCSLQSEGVLVLQSKMLSIWKFVVKQSRCFNSLPNIYCITLQSVNLSYFGIKLGRCESVKVFGSNENCILKSCRRGQAILTVIKLSNTLKLIN